MKPKDWLLVTALIVFYLLEMFLVKRSIFYFKFDEKLIDRYFLSQDIPHEVKGVRQFLSDSDIYLATGYLFANGEDPSLYNFEHPPLIKYLFGFSNRFFGNPYWVQLALGASTIATLYFAALKIYKKRLIGVIACIFLIIDPIFVDVSSQTLLDLGQTFFFLLYFMSFFLNQKNFLLQGIFLGLFAGTKFWITPLFFISLFMFYKILKKEIKWKYFFLQLIVAFVTYSLLYLRTFIIKRGFFNIVYFALRVFKYRLQHNTATLFGSSLLMFVTGYFKTWWGTREFVRTNIWSVFWPLSLLIGLMPIPKKNFLKKLALTDLINLTPFLYLIYLGVQAPFPRYFLIILPFAYLSLAKFLFGRLDQLRLIKFKDEDIYRQPEKKS